MAVTTNNVTWSGGAGAGNPYWNVDANWAGGIAPSNPTPGSIIYTNAGTSVTGVLDVARSVGGILLGVTYEAASPVHTLNLGGYTLTLAGTLDVAMGSRTLILTNGTFQVGTSAVVGSLMVGHNSYGTVILQCCTGVVFSSQQMGTLRVGDKDGVSNAQAGQFDLRGATIAGGVLNMQNLNIGAKGTSYIALDGSTAINAIVVSNTLSMGESGYGGTAYIGNPANSKLPANVSIQVGTSPTQRGSIIQIGKNTSPAQGLTATLAASTGGTFTAYVTNLTVVPYEATYTGGGQQNGTLDISAMTNCAIDAINFNIARDYAGNNPSALPCGTVRLCSGTITAGTVVVGGTVCSGFGLLALSNTMFTVTNSITLNTTATNIISLGAVPKGLDVQGAFIDGGGKIRVNFLADPPVGTTNWAIRVAGNAQSTLGAMVGSGRLTSTNAFVDAAKKAGFIYDASANYSYYALVDTNVTLLPLAIAKSQVTYEMAPGGQVLVAVSEINNGSFDPNNRATTLTISTNGGPDASSLTFNAVGDYAVNLKIVAGTDSATAASTVHIVNLNPGVTNNLTWQGLASTVLMPRREWKWSGNWLEGAPPTNPTPATINYKTLGQSVTGIVEQSRTIGGIYFDSGANAASISHTLDLGGNTLTLAGNLIGADYRGWIFQMTNGTFRIGSSNVTANLTIGSKNPGTLTLAPGTSLDPVNVGTVTLGDCNSSGSGLAVLDLRGCQIVGGVLRMRNLFLQGYSADACVYLDANSGISSIAISNTLSVGNSIGGGTTYIGNPVDGKLPSNISVMMGQSAGQRGNLVFGPSSWLGYARTSKLVASSGGTFTAYLTNLWLSANGVNATAAQYGLLDISKMNTCAIDVQSLLLAPDAPTTPSATDMFQGELRLGPGAVTAGTSVIGATNNAGFGLLVTSNTTITVTNALTINKTGQLTLGIGSQSCGLVISNALNTALSLATATNGALRIAFRSAPAARPFYGLSWQGDHVAALQALQAAGTLVVDSSGLAPKPATIFKTGGATYIGLPPPAGSLFLLR